MLDRLLLFVLSIWFTQRGKSIDPGFELFMLCLNFFLVDFFPIILSHKQFLSFDIIIRKFSQKYSKSVSILSIRIKHWVCQRHETWMEVSNSLQAFYSMVNYDISFKVVMDKIPQLLNLQLQK